MEITFYMESKISNIRHSPKAFVNIECARNIVEIFQWLSVCREVLEESLSLTQRGGRAADRCCSRPPLCYLNTIHLCSQ